MANYYMIGGDGKEYGPVDAVQLRQWVVDGRANAQTLVRPVAGGALVALGMVPELNAPQNFVQSSSSASAQSQPSTDYFMRGGDGKEYGPISVQQLRQWMAEGRANALTMVRAAGGGPTIALGQVPGLFDAPSPRPMTGNLPLAQGLAQNSSLSGGTDSSQLVKRLASVLAEGAGWMKFLAVLSFVSAAFGILGSWGIGILWCWAPIWLGIVLWNAANAAQQAVFTGTEADLIRALDQLRFYFKLAGIFRIVTIALVIVGIVLFFGFIMAALSSAGGNFHSLRGN